MVKFLCQSKNRMNSVLGRNTFSHATARIDKRKHSVVLPSHTHNLPHDGIKLLSVFHGRKHDRHVINFALLQIVIETIADDVIYFGLFGVEDRIEKQFFFRTYETIFRYFDVINLLLLGFCFSCHS